MRDTRRQPRPAKGILYLAMTRTRREEEACLASTFDERNPAKRGRAGEGGGRTQGRRKDKWEDTWDRERERERRGQKRRSGWRDRKSEGENGEAGGDAENWEVQNVKRENEGAGGAGEQKRGQESLRDREGKAARRREN